MRQRRSDRPSRTVGSTGRFVPFAWRWKIAATRSRLAPATRTAPNLDYMVVKVAPDAALWQCRDKGTGNTVS
jgi:hypothetical protein